MSTSLVFADNVKEGNRLYDSGKYQEALSYFMKPDAANNPATMNRIGYMYKKGLGIKENPEEAYKWYRNAAEAGFAAAQFNLGLMYQHGKPIPENMNEAIQWFRKAADQNYPDAEMKMGYLAVTGNQESKKTTKKPCNGTVGRLNMVMSGLMRISAFFTTRDRVSKKTLTEPSSITSSVQKKAIAKPSSFWPIHMPRQMVYPMMPNRALYWYRESAKNGNVLAMKVLSGIYKLGQLGVQKNDAESQRWLDMAEKAEKKQ